MVSAILNTMKIAIPIWNQRVAPVFDSAGTFLLLETDNQSVIAQKEHNISVTAGEALAWLLAEGVELLICGAITCRSRSLIESAGIRIQPFVAGDVSAVLQAWFNHTLDQIDFAMPGCGRGYGQGKGRGRGQGRGCGKQRQQRCRLGGRGRDPSYN